MVRLLSTCGMRIWAGRGRKTLTNCIEDERKKRKHEGGKFFHH